MKRTPVLGNLAQTHVRRLDGMGGNHLADVWRVIKERGDACPVAAPGFDEGRVVGTPLVIELLLLDLSWVSRHPFAQLPTDAVQAVAHPMHQAKLHGRLGVHRFNGFGEILQAICAGDEESR